LLAANRDRDRRGSGDAEERARRRHRRLAALLHRDVGALDPARDPEPEPPRGRDRGGGVIGERVVPGTATVVRAVGEGRGGVPPRDHA